jgi:hypothetical protein
MFNITRISHEVTRWIMNNITIKLYLSFILLICLAICLLVIPSCVQNSPVTYLPSNDISDTSLLKFVPTPNSPFFSFEYPTYYKLIDETINPDPWLNLMLYGHTEEELVAGTIKRIQIHITNYNPKWLDFPNATIAMEENIKTRKWSLKRNFRLLEKHKAIIDGVEGWETVMSYRTRPTLFPVDVTPISPSFIIERDLFFNYQGVTWEISLYTDKESYEKQTKEDFENILRTFKFHE